MGKDKTKQEVEIEERGMLLACFSVDLLCCCVVLLLAASLVCVSSPVRKHARMLYCSEAFLSRRSDLDWEMFMFVCKKFSIVHTRDKATGT
jgi:hypothetical protein